MAQSKLLTRMNIQNNTSEEKAKNISKNFEFLKAEKEEFEKLCEPLIIKTFEPLSEEEIAQIKERVGKNAAIIKEELNKKFFGSRNFKL